MYSAGEAVSGTPPLPHGVEPARAKALLLSYLLPRLKSRGYARRAGCQATDEHISIW